MRTLLFLILIPVLAQAQIGRHAYFTPATSAAVSYTTVYDTVAANNRDGFSEGNDGGEDLTWIKTNYWSGYTTQRYGGVQFQLNIPQGSTIDTCLISLTVADRHWTGENTDSLRWFIYDTVNVNAFGDGHASLFLHHDTSGVYRTESVPIADNGVVYTTTNLAPLLQQVISLAGWVADNYVGFVCQVTSWSADDRYITFYALEQIAGDTGKIARIKVVYH